LAVTSAQSVPAATLQSDVEPPSARCGQILGCVGCGGVPLELVTPEIITDEPGLLIRRTILAPGEMTPWHIDRCRRFTVVVRGERLQIEFDGSNECHNVNVHPGQAEWDEPNEVVHRAINIGASPYEEVVTFYRRTPHQDPQPAE
jgi:quercetin dioxygenase-like cupin family protein